MKIRTFTRYCGLVGGLGLVAVFETGCATKKHVATTIAPLDTRIRQLEDTAKKTGSDIASLEQGVSRADERARSADTRASEALQEASRAGEKANQGIQKAESAERAAAGARSVAEQSLASTRELGKAVDERLSSLDDFKLVGKEIVLFRSSRHELTDDARKQLDGAARTILSHKRYLVEIEGFTDKTGTSDLNLELSRKRAAAVVRYLTTEHKVPLFRIFTAGQGNASPIGDDKTSDGRSKNRRVEVRLFSADDAPADGKKVTAGLTGL